MTGRLRAGQIMLKAVLAALLGMGALAAAQTPAAPLTLPLAVQIALENNPMRKAALADTHVAAAGIGEARSFLLPHITFSETATRGNDPVYVFGTRLRQQRFSAADFSLSRLNTPTPLGNFATHFGGAWTLFDSFASWHGVTRAQLGKQASERQLERTGQEIVFRTVEAYYGVLLAQKQLQVAEQSGETAASIVHRSQARFDSGLVVESDLLTAKVRMAARQQELIRAKNNLSFGLAQLNSAMGTPLESAYQPLDALADRALPIPPLPDLEIQALAKRSDLKRIESEESAQKQSVAMAKSSFGPRVNAFAGWELDNPTLLAGGGGNNWLGGIEVQFDVFVGGAKRAQLQRERALEEKVGALKKAAGDGVRLEVRRAYYDADASRQQVEVARAAITQAQESLRINQDRYDGGLTTITDLLGAEESARRSQTDYWEAVYHFHTSYASLELASGTLTPQSAVVLP